MDGAIGGAFARDGVETGAPFGTATPLQGNFAAVGRAHTDFCMAGAHLIRCNTQETTPTALQRGGYGYRAAKLTSLAVDLATEAVEASQRPVAVCGMLPASVGDARDERVREEQVAHAQRLAASGCDLIMVHGASTLREAVAATAAGVQTELPVFVTLRVGAGAKLSDGESLEAVVGALAAAGARGFVGDPLDPPAEVSAIAELSSLGRPWGVLQALAADRNAEEYANQARSLVDDGALIVGGEDAAGPEHISALTHAIPGALREVMRASLRPSRPPSGIPTSA